MQALIQLEAISREFSQSSQEQKIKKLQELQRKSVFKSKEITQYFQLLLFMKAYHEDNDLLEMIEKETVRMSRLVKQSSSLREKLQDSGLPYTGMFARFTYSFTSYLSQCQQVKVEADSFAEGSMPLHELLSYTLPIPEREHTNAEHTQNQMLTILGVKKKQTGTFLIDQVGKLRDLPLLQEYIWRELKLFFRFEFSDPKISLPNNRLSFTPHYQTKERIRSFDHLTCIQTPLPFLTELSEPHKQELIKVIRLSMLLTIRETDPSTFTDMDSLRYVELDRGISVALYGMKPPHQLPLQSYIGFTLFKNGYPMAYGGSWILGTDAKFGMNIFEWFRGGESGWVFIQLIRVYKHLFQLKQIEIDAYQFGKDNPDGIRSGAFWFYYRYGFRPINIDLKKLAKTEHDKMVQGKQQRSSEKTLLRFAESNMKLTFEKADRMPWDYYQMVTRFVQKEYSGNRSEAQNDSVSICNIYKGIDATKYSNELREWSLLARVFKCHGPEYATILQELIQTKSSNPYRYNERLIELFTQLKTRPVNANT